MKHIIHSLFLLLAITPGSLSAAVLVHAHSSENNVELTLDPENGKMQKSPSSASSVTQTSNFTIRGGTLYRNGKLFHNEQSSFKATEILAQGTANGIDIAVVRIETLSLGNPLALLAGHPKQVSKIVVVGFRNGRQIWQHRIAKEAYSTKWQASISPAEA